MEQKRLESLVRQSIKDYKMIEAGDRIAVGVSGGKDSLALLCAINGISKYSDSAFEIVAVTVDLGFEAFDIKPITDLCNRLNIQCEIIHTTISDLAKANGCGLCSRTRKGALSDRAKELNCNKIAYAHTKDDVVETLMLSLIYEGRFSSFRPVTYFEDSNLEVIRPLIYVSEADVIGFINKYNISISKNPCPYDKNSERSYVRQLLSEINKHTPGVKERLFTALVNSDIREWNKS